jgi:hypothetical protein
VQHSTRAELACGEEFQDIGRLFHGKVIYDGTHLALCGELEHRAHLLAVAEEGGLDRFVPC